MGDKVRVRELDPESQELVISLFKGNPEGAARFGEGGYIMPSVYRKNVDDLKNMPVRPDDTWVVTYPRSGMVYL
ncbi:hypothetical protein MSG28_003093 [Choristoneura fumiferana]|uniref:Uncharacterized protein n=1 Tax=Choristoneura fumiferana TaxID=7141 RepID=A0ACC0KE13_CHOFU|nr:hypothetical protein MSG28_003093 [Choristoneura fumiferana]